jgi:hypothetical protein
MKTLTTLALTVALTGGAFSVQAGERSERELSSCMAELQAYYGDEIQLNLVDKRRNEHGTRMRVAAKLDADNSYFANCWVANDHTSDFAEGDMGNMVAAAATAADAD